MTVPFTMREIPVEIPGVPKDAILILALFLNSEGCLVTMSNERFDFHRLLPGACEFIGQKAAETIHQMMIRQDSRISPE